jgi:hypothetical protein
MKQTNDKSTMETQTTIKKVLDFIIGFLGSLILASIGIVLMGQFNDPQPIWVSYFLWFWRLFIVGVAVISFTKKRIWISVGIIAAIIDQVYGML